MLSVYFKQFCMNYSHQSSVYTFSRYSSRRRSTAAVLPRRCRFKIEDKTRTVEAVGRQLNCRTFFCESLLATGAQLDRYNDSKLKPRSRQKVRKSVGAHKVTEGNFFAFSLDSHALRNVCQKILAHSHRRLWYFKTTKK